VKIYEKGTTVEHVDHHKWGEVMRRITPTTLVVHWHDGSGTTDEHITDLKPVTGKLTLTAFQSFVASGSDISNPTVDSGYQRKLVQELARIVPDAGTIIVDAEGAKDLAEFAWDLSVAVGQEPNPSGARSLAKLNDEATNLAKKLELS